MNEISSVASTVTWYDTKTFSVLVGASVTIITFVLTQLINYLRESKSDKKNLVILMTQTNSLLFSLIYQGSLNKKFIDYAKLREELEKTNLIFILPKDLRASFLELYKIHFMGPDYYREKKANIHNLLEKIVKEIEKYGVESFGNK